MHQSFLNIQRYRYALYAGLLGAACTVSYVVDSWRERPAGDTVLGYTLGGIAAALVLFLLSYGIRRRSFHARAGATKRWLSMHVYLGVCVVLVATLHSGLQFGWNVHTLAYGLLCTVVLSGCWGVYAYIRYPTLIARERGADSRTGILAVGQQSWTTGVDRPTRPVPDDDLGYPRPAPLASVAADQRR